MLGLCQNERQNTILSKKIIFNFWQPLPPLVPGPKLIAFNQCFIQEILAFLQSLMPREWNYGLGNALFLVLLAVRLQNKSGKLGQQVKNRPEFAIFALSLYVIYIYCTWFFFQVVRMEYTNFSPDYPFDACFTLERSSTYYSFKKLVFRLLTTSSITRSRPPIYCLQQVFF